MSKKGWWKPIVRPCDNPVVLSWFVKASRRLYPEYDGFVLLEFPIYGKYVYISHRRIKRWIVKICERIKEEFEL